MGVERHSERVMILKMVVDTGLLNVSQLVLLTQRNQRRKKNVFGVNCSIC